MGEEFLGQVVLQQLNRIHHDALVKFYSKTLALGFFPLHVSFSLFHLHYAKLELLPEPPTLAGGFPATSIPTGLELKGLPSPLPLLPPCFFFT